MLRWRQDKDLAVFTSGRVSGLLQRCWWARNTNWWRNNFFHTTTAAFFQSVQGGFNSISIVLDSLFVPRNWMLYLWLESVWNYGASPRGDKRFWESQFQWLVLRVGWKLSFHLSTLFFYYFFLLIWYCLTWCMGTKYPISPEHYSNTFRFPRVHIFPFVKIAGDVCLIDWWQN